jgi:hypothetical protein
MARLIVNPGTASAWEIQLRAGVNSIGRGFANDFRIDHESISTAHCQIVVADNDTRLTDLGSTNGTFVGGVAISEVFLNVTQTIQLGAVQVLFEPGPPSENSQTRSSPESLTLPNFGTGRTPEKTTPSFQAAPPLAVFSSTASAGSTVSIPTQPVGTRSSLSPGLLIAHQPPAIAGTATADRQLVNISSNQPPSPLHLSGPCKLHPKTAGRYYCPGCRNFFCDFCINSRTISGIAKKFCRQCGGELSKVIVQTAHAPAEAEKGFFARVPSAFGFPFKGSGVFVLLIATILISCMQFAGPMKVGRGMRVAGPMGVMLQIMVIGYVFSYMQTILHVTATGDNEMPPLPGMDNMWEDILLPCLKMLGLIGACFAPAILLVCLRIGTDDSALGVALVPTFILCLIYFPMAFLAVAILDNVAAANPFHIIPAIMKVPLEYLVTLALLAAMFAMRFFGDELIPLIFPKGIGTHQMHRLIGFLAAHAVWAVICMYLLTVSIRILGLLYVTKKEKLGWLS